MPRVLLPGLAALALFSASFPVQSARAADYDYIGSANWQSWTSALAKWQLSGTTTTPGSYPGENDNVYLNWQDGDHRTYADGSYSYGMQVGSSTLNNLYVNPNGLGGNLQLYSNNDNVVLAIKDTLYVAASAATPRSFVIRGEGGGGPSLSAGNINVSGTETARATLTLGEYNSTSRALSAVTVTGTTTIGNGLINISEIKGTISLGEMVMTHPDAQLRLVTSANLNKNFTVHLSGIHSLSTGDGTITIENASILTAVTQAVTLDINTAASDSFVYSGRLADNISTSPGSGTVTLSIIKDGSGVQKFTGNNNTYSGTTEIRDGVLLASNTDSSASATGTGDVSVKTGGTLGGTGYISGAVATESSGRIAPGDTGAAGTLTINNTLTLADSTVLDFDLATANATGGTGGNDFIQVNGDLALGSSVTLSALANGGALADGKYALFGYTGTLSGTENLGTWSLSGLILAANQSAIFGNDASTVFLQLSTTAIPEPGTWAVIIGVSAFACVIARRRIRR
jgi:autotransporter-associated beta strand protein